MAHVILLLRTFLGSDACRVMHFFGGAFEEKLGNKEMKEFLSFLKVHPRWSNVEHFWSDLSEGFEISKEEFVRDSRLLLLRFTNQQMIKGAMPDVSIESRVELIFSQLDVQMSGGVGLKELIPMSGEGLADVQSNLAKFKIPLDYLKEIRIEGDAHDDRPYLRFQVHPDFESSPEWRSLKMGLSPDWEPNQGLEYLRVGMAPHHLDVWKRVILDWGMDDSVVQESIRFYQGRTISHPTIDGVHMRSGKGVQRWPDGKMYCGYWDDHLYNGEGSLFNDYQDMTRGVNPIYKGEWQRGKRHGWGVFRWEQGAPEGNPHGAGQSSEVFKVYEGEFVNDLFNGQGSMKVENAPFVTTTQHQGVGPGCVPLPCLDPVSIMSFEGTWASDWYQADEEARASSSLYDHLHPKEEEAPRHEKTAKLHLNLHNIKSTQSKDPKFLRYFSADSLGVQRAGKPLPDLALAYYQQQGCDAKHMTKGRALYADFTVYIGDYACGVPDGSGEMTQYEYNGTKGKPLAHYKGYWKNGQFHGAGRYQTADGLTYDGQFVENLRHGFGVEEVSKDLALKLGYGKYEGEWKNGVFHGQGRLTSADGRVFEGHFVEGQRQAGGRELKPETKGLPNLFGSMLKKPKVDGEDVLHAPDELRFLHETIGQLRHRPRSAPEPPSDLEDVIIKGGTGENEVMNGVYFRLTHTFGHRVFKMVKKVGIFQSVVRYLYLDDASESWVISAQPLSGICSASGCAFVPEDAKHPSLVTKPWYVWHGFSKTLRVVGEECEEEEDERQTFSLGSLRGTPSPVDLLEAKSIIGFQLTGHADGEVVLGMMRRIPMIQFGRPVYAHQSGGQYLYFHRKGSTNKWDGAFQEELGPGIDPKPKLYEDRGYWIFAAELGNLPESPGCHGFVEDNAVTPDQISGTWKVKVADQMQRSPALKLVPREWSDEHLLHDTGTSGAARTMVRS